MTYYLTFSSAHTAVVKEGDRLERLRQLGASVLTPWVTVESLSSVSDETPIFDRVAGRRGTDRGVPGTYSYNLFFAGWAKKELIEYIVKWSPGAKPGRLDRRTCLTLRKMAEDVRDWRGFESRYPSDEDLLLHCK